MWYFFGAKKINISEVKRGAYELPQVLNAYVLPQSTLAGFVWFQGKVGLVY